MSEINLPEQSPDQRAELRKRVEEFFSHFDGAVVQNHLGKPVKIRLRKTSGDSGETDEYLLEFEGFTGYSPNQDDGNYVQYQIDYDNPPRIIPDYALLTDPRLKSNIPEKGVFPEIRRMTGKYFPEGFVFLTEIVNFRTAEQLYEIYVQYKNKKIGLSKAVEMIRYNYKVQERFKSGFNSITVYFSGGLILISAQKIPNHPQEFDVVFGNI